VSTGYGNRFYKKQKKKPIQPILIFVIVACSVVLFYFLGNSDKTSFNTNDNPGSQTAKRSQFGIPDEAEAGPEIEQVPIVIVEEREPIDPLPLSTQKRVSPQVIQQRLEVQQTAKKGVALYNKKKYQQALNLFKRIESKDAHAPLYIGLCHYQLANYDLAYQFFSKILDANASHFLAKKYLAFTYYKMDDLDNSMQMATEALSLKNDRELLSLRKKLAREQHVMKGQGYLDARKPNFKIQFSKFDHNEIKEIVVDILNDAHRTIGGQINFYPKKVVTVILYNEKSFFDVTRAPGWAGGLYDGKIRIPVKGAELNRSLLKRVLYHEYSHALVHAITPRCPLWLNEGLAEYFSNSDGQRIGQVIPLNKIKEAFHSRNTKRVALAYMESFSAVVRLIEKYALYRIKELLEKMAKGEDFSKAFRSIYYIPFSKFLSEWN